LPSLLQSPNWFDNLMELAKIWSNQK
jgi:hypothetical protein